MAASLSFVAGLAVHYWLAAAPFVYASLGSVNPTWWSSVAQLGAQSALDPDAFLLLNRGVCNQLPGLSPGQASICELFLDHMPAVGAGTHGAIKECQFQFKDERWNCSTPFGSGYIGPVHIQGTREAAFTYAMIAAGVTHAVGRSCRKNSLGACGCSEAERPRDLDERWRWAGCGDNVEYSYQFARNFVDVREREFSHAKRSLKHVRAQMNRWNNEVGRRVLRRMVRPHCKCHGVSGSCNLKTCWQQMPTLRQTGEELAHKYRRARRVKVNQQGNLQMMAPAVRRRQRQRRPAAVNRDLIYLDESPDYCRPNASSGTVGTRGRHCNRTAAADDSCDALCCGRGYNQFSQLLHEKCDCKFEWCCKVVCKICQRKVDTFTCK